MKPPPPVLASAHVLAYAAMDKTVRWTGRQVLLVDGRPLGRVPRLAICRNLFHERTGLLIFHCDTRWNVLAIAGAPTLRECKAKVEAWYEGSTSKWVRSDVSQTKAIRWAREAFKSSACSFCSRLPAEAEGMFSKGCVNVCFKCVEAMHESMLGGVAQSDA